MSICQQASWVGEEQGYKREKGWWGNLTEALSWSGSLEFSVHDTFPRGNIKAAAQVLKYLGTTTPYKPSKYSLAGYGLFTGHNTEDQVSKYSKFLLRACSSYLRLRVAWRCRQPA